MTDNSALAPCPWCGGPGNLIDVDGEALAHGWQVSCGNDQCTVQPFTSIEGDQAEAIAAWNRRTPPAPAAEIERLQAIIERDRSKCADVLGAIKKAIAGREWLRLGRGSYEWNDDRWRDEFATAIDEIVAAAEPLRKIAADLSDSPRSSTAVAAARAPLTAPVTPVDGELAELIDWCLRASTAIYAGADKIVADDISPRLRQIAALLRLPREREGWRAIETAPKDGTPFLVGWSSGIWQAAVAHFEADDAEPVYFINRSGAVAHFSSPPTHWQPLPSSPSKETTDD